MKLVKNNGSYRLQKAFFCEDTVLLEYGIFYGQIPRAAG
ncbi:hypothetical protein KNP414_04798 [Paenibacillus mucilaginosus KNP414]|uniref:Uncharacterized protein n=1 Tax=Paenibacillus mucilaginosus (strain KNP414) TaxID=1036673 RepID=F8FHY6_PAEMK|nr:hypothetical protein KNP414_04798 [Paenibacillus mucilaginosus KNP414]